MVWVNYKKLINRKTRAVFPKKSPEQWDAQLSFYDKSIALGSFAENVIFKLCEYCRLKKSCTHGHNSSGVLG